MNVGRKTIERENYQEIQHYEQWLAGQHGAHDSSQEDNYLYCDTCKLKFRTGLSQAQIHRALSEIKKCLNEALDNHVASWQEFKEVKRKMNVGRKTIERELKAKGYQTDDWNVMTIEDGLTWEDRGDYDTISDAVNDVIDDCENDLHKEVKEQ